ncbi:hypothetical protein QFC20_007528 [Naganishia adeliensis]|uniref:Uncharacterized protein n=1 Tax=Naganishia adeliensis TaxID=92952 RepID=A0ACC2UYA7_9TREE|nr:hypothetical protein QFC20_007528 [Naganishia adeliensis]
MSPSELKAEVNLLEALLDDCDKEWKKSERDEKNQTTLYDAAIGHSVRRDYILKDLELARANLQASLKANPTNAAASMSSSTHSAVASDGGDASQTGKEPSIESSAHVQSEDGNDINGSAGADDRSRRHSFGSDWSFVPDQALGGAEKDQGSVEPFISK